MFLYASVDVSTGVLPKDLVIEYSKASHEDSISAS
jgi:hypothetical protein